MAQQFVVQGRIVFGHPIKGRVKKDIRTKQPIIKDGQQVMQYVFGVAIEKNAFYNQPIPPSNMSIAQMLQHEARVAFPAGIPQNFSYKFKDGDGVDSKGQPYSKREGYAGHCVLTISTEGFAPQVFKSNGQGGYTQLQENEIKCGDFVAVNITAKYNGAVSPNTPGLYINPNGVVHIGYGQEISSGGQDPDEMFAGMQVQQFAGMSAQPMMAQGGAAAPGMGMQPQQYAQAPMQAAPQQFQQPMQAQPQQFAQPAPMQQPQQYAQAPMQAAPQPGQMPPPAMDFVNNAMGQPQQFAQPGQMPQQPQQFQQPMQAQPQQYAQAPMQGMPGMPQGR